MFGLSAIALSASTLACSGDPQTPPGSVRFGQVGDVRVKVVTPLTVVVPPEIRILGEVSQTLTWSSSGAWQLFETVSYQGMEGDAHLTRNVADPTILAGAYASFITRINDTDELKLFVATLDPALRPDCVGSGVETRSTVEIRVFDAAIDEQTTWVRCGNGLLGDLAPAGAGPDTDAARVIQAAVLAREFALGPGFHSVFSGTRPFGTLDRGEDSGADLTGPLVFQFGPGAAESLDAPDRFEAFWAAHTRGARPPPPIDWDREVVLVAAVGTVREAGDSVEVRRVTQDRPNATLVEYVERIPGDFCSPAERVQRPFHVVVTPKVDPVVRFATLREELVPCGF